MDIDALTVEPDRTAAEIGSLLRSEREKAALTQVELAHRTGVSQATVSAVERGARHPSLSVLDQLLAALGRRLVVGTESIDLSDAELDAAIEALLGVPPADRLRARHFDGVALLRQLAPAAPVLEGAAAAVLHGVPVPCAFLEVAVGRDRLADLAEVIRAGPADRWDDVWLQWNMAAPDPRVPGSQRWWLPAGEFRVRTVDERPGTVTILADGLPVPVRLLHEVAATDRRVRRALARLPELRTRASPGRGPGARSVCGCGQPAKNEALSARSSSGWG